MASAYTYNAQTGLIEPDTQDILAQVQAEYLGTFGADLNLAPNTPQGLLISAETLARSSVADNNAAIANQINPNRAGGIFLDALMSLTGASRSVGTPSIALCTIGGVIGTSIPAGAQISDASGNLYQLESTTVIPLGGTISGVAFTSVLNGAIPGTAGTLTVIVSNILGWETVTNPDDAILGQATQSDNAAKQLRQVTLGAQGNGLAQATIAAVSLLAPGTSLWFQENPTSSPATINSVPMVANSLYACVSSTATLLQIATAINNSKGGGCAYNNGLGIPQSQNVTNVFSGQVIPVLFDTPSIVTISMTITVHAFTAVQNIQNAVQQAVLDYAAGKVGKEPGFVVGASVSPFQIAGAINIEVPGLFVQSVQVGVSSFTQQGTLTATMNTVTGLTYNAPVGGFVGIATGMGVTDGHGTTNIPASTTVASLVGSTALTLNHSSSNTITETLTFTPSLVLQTTTIPIAPWQQATTSAIFITVLTV